MPRRIVLWATVALSLSVVPSPIRAVQAVADDEPDPAVQKELKALEGKWKLVAMTSHGTELDEKRIQGLSTVIEGDRLQAWNARLSKPQGTFKISLYPAEKPKAMDLTVQEGPGQGMVIKYIYKVEGDKLTFCFSSLAGVRPEEFESKPKSLLTLTVYEREKP